PRPNPELEKRFTTETRRPAGLIRYCDGCDWLSDAVIRLSVQIETSIHLDPDLTDLIGLVVSQDNSCRFCFGAQRAFLRILGMEQARITRLEQDLLISDFSEQDRTALDFARRLSRSDPLVKSTDLEAIRQQGISDAEIKELAGQIGLHVFFNRISTLVALPPKPMEQFPDTWWARLARPLLAIRFRQMRKRGQAVDLSRDERDGPFSAVVNGLDGLPVAGQLRIVLDNLLSSNAITPRAVPLIFAVIARALGCKASEREAARLLVERGLDENEVAEVLTHLSSPDLSEVERKVVVLARETVWYQPVQIQRKCREFGADLTREQFLEFVGAASVANAICRLGVLSGDCQ
ncbi:MAG: carboxymuconolactone decarboxylase family protein, partial [Gammaproteobacteria bacterium]